MDPAMLDMLMEQMVGGGAPAAGGITPRLTARSQNLPGQGYDKMKADLATAPQDPMAAGMTGTPLPNGGSPDVVQMLLEQIMQGQGSGVMPEMQGTKAGAPMRGNQNLMSQLLAEVLGQTGKDIRPDGPDAKAPYDDDPYNDSVEGLPPLVDEDMEADDGYWDAQHRGDGRGQSFMTVNGKDVRADPLGHAPAIQELLDMVMGSKKPKTKAKSKKKPVDDDDDD